MIPESQRSRLLDGDDALYSASAQPTGAGQSVLTFDDFAMPLPSGAVVGAPNPQGGQRKGVDREKVISIDNGALRIKPLIQPGWGRAGIAYGPFERRNGRALAVFMINGHNTAQSENLSESFTKRLDRWLRGPDLYSRPRRLLQWLRNKRKSRMFRQWAWWRHISMNAAPVPRVNENLAVGWFANEQPDDPLAEGNGFVMHATGAENGELWTRVGAAMLPAVRGVQNLQIHYIVVLRERGAAYYASSVPGANGLGSHPNMRPLAIDPFNDDPLVYAGVFQSTLGQIGFRLDTRIYGTRVADLPEWATWYGTAHAADGLSGSGALLGSSAAIGGAWRQAMGRFERTPNGVVASEANSLALLYTPEPSGLIHVIVDGGAKDARAAGLVWRYLDPENYWQLTVSATACQVLLRQAGRSTIVAHSDHFRLGLNKSHSLQIADEGHRFSLFLDGELLFGTRFSDERLWRAAGVGIVVPSEEGGARLTFFEAHPLECRLPISLDQGRPWWRLGQEDIVTDSFHGPAGDLDGRQTTTGAQKWRRIIGIGRIDVTGRGSAKVRASAAHGCPGRLAYAVDWSHPEFADLEVEITPPGSARGQSEEGRAGLLFWQDEANFLLVNNWLHDGYEGASVSCFTCQGGFEDLYDAVWSNVGAHLSWGVAHRFRVVFDGTHILAFVDEQPVLYRALTDIYSDASSLRINRVGLLANWEWGTDTGSVFRDFRARI